MCLKVNTVLGFTSLCIYFLTQLSLCCPFFIHTRGSAFSNFLKIITNLYMNSHVKICVVSILILANAQKISQKLFKPSGCIATSQLYIINTTISLYNIANICIYATIQLEGSQLSFSEKNLWNGLCGQSFAAGLLYRQVLQVLCIVW